MTWPRLPHHGRVQMKMRQGWNGRLEGEGVERARTLSLHCELRVFVEPRELFHRQVAEVELEHGLQQRQRRLGWSHAGGQPLLIPPV